LIIGRLLVASNQAVWHFVYSCNFRTKPSKEHPDIEDFWDTGKDLQPGNTFEESG
jgi:hypothetical protein